MPGRVNRPGRVAFRSARSRFAASALVRSVSARDGTGHRVEALLLRRSERRVFGRRTQIGGAAVRGDRIPRVLEPEERGDLAEGAPFLAKGERLLVAPLFLVLLT